MSLDKNYFVIAGYDLTEYRTEKYDDWKWTDEGEQYICYQSKGHIQLFDDPMDSNHLYLGYVLVHGDEYYMETTKLNVEDILSWMKNVTVNVKLRELIEIGVVASEAESAEYQFIIFEECY